MKLVQPPHTSKYDVRGTDTLSSIALRFDTTPSELSRLNHLASSLLFPGQTLFVPENVGTSPPTEEHKIPFPAQQQQQQQNTTQDTSRSHSPIKSTSPIKTKSQSFSHSPLHSPTKVTSPRHNTVLVNDDYHLERLLLREDSEEEISKRFLRIKSRYITDGQGVVSGVLLVTPQTIMFNPSVSDHLVMDRGRDAYLVKLPLKAISNVIVFEEIAAMVTDDLSKQYIPNYEQYRPVSPPRPGMIVCRDTGEEFAIKENSPSSPSSRPSSFKDATLLQLAQQQLEQARGSEQDSDSSPIDPKNSSSSLTHDNGQCSTSTDQGLGSMDSSNLTDTLVNTNSTGEASSSTGTVIDSREDSSLGNTDSSAANTNDNSRNLTTAPVINHDEFGDFQSSSTPKHAPFTTANKNDNKKDLNLNLNPQTTECTSRDSAKPTFSSNESESENTRSCLASEVSPQAYDHSKDSGISDMTQSHSTVESNDLQHPSPERQDSRTSLSDEARKWLGKHSISQDGSMSPDIEPRPTAEFQDPLIYISIKVSKRYWCPTLQKHNAIMGVPPNRDQKRRQHWFAIPREKVDQFYGFVVHWLPELYSGISTPSSDGGNNDLDEGLNIVEDTFADSPATSFGWEKINTEDAESMKKLRVDSIQSSSSKLSLRSLDDEPETSAESQLLTKDQLKYLVRSLPSITVGHMMELVYSTSVHGISLKTLYRNFEDFDTTALIVVRDENHRAFGAFLSHPPAISESFYGTGECLLFSFITEKKVKTYKWSGENSFFIKGSKTSLTVGGGLGVLGLWLDEDLYHGRTHACSTFNNELLSENEDFICTGLEAWAFV
eukprot:TCONS_00016432-protein